MTTESPPGQRPGSSDAPRVRTRHRSTRSSLKQMVVLGGLGLCALALVNAGRVSHTGPLWRVFAAIAAFLYLWWLAALLFDLVFVWHRYIQSDASLRFLRAEVQRRDLSTRGDSARNEESAGH